MSETVIALQNVSYRYPRSDRYVLKHLNLEIGRGEFITIVGENGAGKTTLCQILSGIIPQSQGGRLLGDVKVCGLDTKTTNLSILSQKVGIVLEDPETQLFTSTVLQEVAFGMENLQLAKDEILERARWALDVVTMNGFENRHPHNLSGGQKQRIAIASVLTMRPDILVLDEPTSQLDPVGTVEVFEVIKRLKEEYGMTIVMATHKSEEIALFADRLMVIGDGEIMRFAPPREIFSDTELVSKAWITRPQVSALYYGLKDQGIALENFPIRKDETKKMLEDILDGRES